jgi:hypothetical protein
MMTVRQTTSDDITVRTASGMKRLSQLLLIAAGLLVACPLQAGKLDRVRDETSDSSSHDDDDDDDNDSGILGVLGAIFSGGSDDGETTQVPASPPGPRAFYLNYPYAGGQSGSLRVVSRDPLAELELSTASAGLKQGRVQFWGEGAADWDGLYRGTMGISAQLAGSFGFETRGSLWHEPLVGPDDDLVFWDGNLLLEAVASPEFQVDLGAGLRGLFDPSGKSEPKGGGHGLLRFNIYPANPLVFHLTTTLGILNKSFMGEGQGTVGVQLRNFELYGGYSAWAIGEVVLHGPLLGVRATL